LPSAGSGSPSPVGPSAGTSFAAFLDGVRSARYADFAGRGGAAVRDEAAFEEMRGYLIRRYGEAVPAGSVTDPAGAVFDCLSFPPSPHPSAAVTGCPAGSVPVRRVTLDELVRFATLADFLGKGPPGEGVPPS
jgi:hypothetical protein